MLNHAAAVFGPRALRILVFTLFCSVGLAASASALDGIDLSSAPEPSAEGECSQLVKIKYPFVRCASGEIGQTEGDDTWENSRYIQIGSDWVEGGGWFGPDLNRD